MSDGRRSGGGSDLEALDSPSLSWREDVIVFRHQTSRVAAGPGRQRGRQQAAHPEGKQPDEDNGGPTHAAQPRLPPERSEPAAGVLRLCP